MDRHDGVQSFLALGFVVVATPRAKGFKVVMEPWRKSGVDGWFSDRRADSVHTNSDKLPVFSAGLVCASDGFNYFSPGGRNFSVNATYAALGCLSPALARCLRSWYMCSLGAARCKMGGRYWPFHVDNEGAAKRMPSASRDRWQQKGYGECPRGDRTGFFVIFTGGGYNILDRQETICLDEV